MQRLHYSLKTFKSSDLITRDIGLRNYSQLFFLIKHISRLIKPKLIMRQMLFLFRPTRDQFTRSVGAQHLRRRLDRYLRQSIRHHRLCYAAPGGRRRVPWVHGVRRHHCIPRCRPFQCGYADIKEDVHWCVTTGKIIKNKILKFIILYKYLIGKDPF